MSHPSIEFSLQPPSPGLCPAEPCMLPPISTLLRDIPESPPFQSCLFPPSPQHGPMLQVESPTLCSPCTSPCLSPLSSPSLSPQPHLLLPPPRNTRHSRSPSNASTASSCSSMSLSLPSPSLAHQNLSDPSYASTYESLSPSWQPLSPSLSTSSSPTNTTADARSVACDDHVQPKRKRGRPPHAATHRENWTFVKPTVWDVKHPQQSVDKELSMMMVVWPDGDKDANNSNNHSQEQQMNRIFTSTKMDSTLTMPRKKRGRKPKTQLTGNSCFVWRDLTARRGTFKPSPSPSLS